MVYISMGEGQHLVLVLTPDDLEALKTPGNVLKVDERLVAGRTFSAVTVAYSEVPPEAIVANFNHLHVPTDPPPFSQEALPPRPAV